MEVAHCDRTHLQDFLQDFQRFAPEVVLDMIPYTQQDAQIVMNYPTLAGTIVRLPMTYGPHDQQHRLFAYLKRMDDHRQAIILGERFARWRWSRGYVGNVAAAIVLAMTDARATGRIYHISEEPTLMMKQWVQAIAEAAGWRGTVVSVPEERLPEHLAVKSNTSQELVYDTSRIRQELGYCEVVSFDEALKQTIAWQRAHPPGKIDAGLFEYASEDAVLSDGPKR